MKTKRKRAVLSGNHWRSETYYETMPLRDLQEIMLDSDGWIIFNGCKRALGYKKIAPGIYRLFKKPEERDVNP